MRILQVLVGAAARTGGPVAFAGEGSVELVKAGADVRLFATDLALAPWGWVQRQREVKRDELHSSLAEADMELFRTRFPKRLAYTPSMARALREEMERTDVVHIHNLWQYPQYAAFKAARDAGVPYVVSPHGGLDPYLRQRGRARKALTMRLWQRATFERAALIHVTTAAEERLIADVAPGVPREVVPCGIHVDEFSRLPLRDEFRRDYLDGYDGPLVVFLGRVTDKKGVDVLISSIAHVRQRMAARLAIVGPDDSGLRPKLEGLAAELGVADDVVFTDAVYGRDRLAALATADAWALSSHTENFGIAVVEAMAAGCAVVISPYVNLADDVAAAQAGVIADTDPRVFGDGLLEILGDAKRREALRGVAKDFAARYDWRAVTPRLLEMYQRAAVRPAEPVPSAPG